MTKRPPNILLLWTDEQRADTLAAYGNRSGIMPCLDRFAREATVFDHAYCASPVCTPSRGSIMTGVFPHHHGAEMNNVPMRAEARSLAEYLPEYETGYIGKWHLGDEIFAQHGFRTWINVDDSYRRYYGPGRDRLARCDYHHWLVARGYKPDDNDGGFSRDFVARLPEAHSKPRYQADRAIEYLRRHAGGPWLLSVNTLEPHMPFTGPRNDQYDPGELPLAPNFLVPPAESCLLRTRMLQRLQRHRPHAGCQPSDESSVRRTMANYWGLCSQVDHHFGRVLNALADSGQWDNTLIVFTSDHGDQMGSHALVGKGVMFEESARIPLIVKMPGQKGGGRVAGPVSQVDLVPTILDGVGVSVWGVDGCSLVPSLSSGQAPDRDVVLVWHESDGRAIDCRLEGNEEACLSLGPLDQLARAMRGQSRCLVTPDRWKLIVSDQGECELYDLESDPFELRSRAGDADCRRRRDEMYSRLRAWQAAMADPLALPPLLTSSDAR